MAQREEREDTAPPHPAWFPPAWHRTGPYVGERAGGCSQGVPGRALPVWSTALAQSLPDPSYPASLSPPDLPLSPQASADPPMPHRSSSKPDPGHPREGHQAGS